MLVTADIIVLVLILLVPVLIGIYFGYSLKIKKFLGIDKNNEVKRLAEYLTASSDMGTVPIAFWTNAVSHLHHEMKEVNIWLVFIRL